MREQIATFMRRDSDTKPSLDLYGLKLMCNQIYFYYLIFLYLLHFKVRLCFKRCCGIRQRHCQYGCWHSAYKDVFTASIDGHTPAPSS